jgi:hypothetical protein
MLSAGIDNELTAQKIPVNFIEKADNLATLEIQCWRERERDR